MQCSARCRNSKKPCKGQAVTGATVCRLHGGSAPQVRRKAAQRLGKLILPELSAAVERILKGKGSDADFLAASKALAIAKRSEQIDRFRKIRFQDGR